MIRDRSQSTSDNTRPADPVEAQEPGDPPPARSRQRRSLRDNQARLGVNPEHKTETMRKRHRGTYP